MKKASGLFLFILLSVSCIYAQEIKYEKSLEDALALSAKNFKPVFICLNIPAPPPAMLSANRTPFPNGLTAPQVIEFYRKNFNSY